LRSQNLNPNPGEVPRLLPNLFTGIKGLDPGEELVGPFPANPQAGGQGILRGLNLGLEEIALAGAVQLTDQEPQQIQRGVAPQRRYPLGQEVAKARHDRAQRP
jgi:hypothetical protein